MSLLWSKNETLAEQHAREQLADLGINDSPQNTNQAWNRDYYREDTGAIQGIVSVFYLYGALGVLWCGVYAVRTLWRVSAR